MSTLDRTRPRPRRDDEGGFVAIMFVLCLSAFMIGVAALAVDVGRWYVEVQRVQRAADAGALAGVEYLPQDMTSASSTARTSATVNGYTDGVNGASVAVGPGSKTSQLKVSVCGTVKSIFGGLAGINSTTICRAAVADFTGPAPLGSPCNTFGNEPTTGGGSLSPLPTGTALGASKYNNCKSYPQIWALIEGPQAGKGNGDRFQTLTCSSGNDGCTSGVNTEYDKAGYFWTVHVDPTAVGQPIDVQLFDPAFIMTGQTCGSLPAAGTGTNTAQVNSNTWNDYVTDAKTRYTPSSFSTFTNGGTMSTTCPGDIPLADYNPVVTTFAMRQQTDSLNPLTAPAQNADSPSLPCLRQYTGLDHVPTALELKKGSSTYNDELAKEFHNWTSFCKFTPSRAGDYYLEVRTDVAIDGSNIGTNGLAYTGDPLTMYDSSLADLTSGGGANAFSIRAVTAAGMQKYVSVSAYNKMPLFANANASTATFNLIRVLPGAAGKSISFSLFDVGDASSSGTVTVSVPVDSKNASGALSSQSTSKRFPNGCKAVGGNAGTGATYSNCAAPITNSTNNGKTETVSIPIPTDYTCDYTDPTGCWYQVTTAFPSGTVNDVTTWTADIVGQPVRLIQ